MMDVSKANRCVSEDPLYSNALSGSSRERHQVTVQLSILILKPSFRVKFMRFGKDLRVPVHECRPHRNDGL